jgi:imidazolonepropionase-like amidohydrolase
MMPGALPMTVEEGIADGVDQVRYAVRYQIKHGAQLIKICASGGVMSDSGPAGAQHYSDDELYAIVDEAHRRGLKVAAHTHGAPASSRGCGVVAGRPRGRAGHGRMVAARQRAGLAHARPPARCGPGAVRPADRGLPGRPAQARRHALDGLLGSTRELIREAGRVVIAAGTAPRLIDL